MRELTVDLGERAYPIYIGQSLLAMPELFTRHVGSRPVLIVSNDTVAPLYLEQLRAALPAHAKIGQVILPDGEQYKNLQVLDQVYSALLQQHFNRRCIVLALGGGVVGDMAGFAAASYQRGVDFIQVPTTLLSQVDSSVGGKTGVNHALGKNMIGAFHQPLAVIADTSTLDTLPGRELSAGLAEVIKYGLINDPEFFAWLEQNMESLRQRDPEHLAYAIERSCQDKAVVVAADEKEAGSRALLNLGHTFGHAIETGLGYGEWLHGEAVGTGMAMAADMSMRLGWLSTADARRAKDLIARAGLSAEPPSLPRERWLELMSVDKKVLDGRLRLVLLRGIGGAQVTSEFDQQALLDTLPN